MRGTAGKNRAESTDRRLGGARCKGADRIFSLARNASLHGEAVPVRGARAANIGDPSRARLTAPHLMRAPIPQRRPQLREPAGGGWKSDGGRQLGGNQQAPVKVQESAIPVAKIEFAHSEDASDFENNAPQPAGESSANPYRAGFFLPAPNPATTADHSASRQGARPWSGVSRALQRHPLPAFSTSRPRAFAMPQDAGTENEWRGHGAKTSDQTAERQWNQPAARRALFPIARDWQRPPESRSRCRG